MTCPFGCHCCCLSKEACPVKLKLSFKLGSLTAHTAESGSDSESQWQHRMLMRAADIMEQSFRAAPSTLTEALYLAALYGGHLQTLSMLAAEFALVSCQSDAIKRNNNECKAGEPARAYLQWDGHNFRQMQFCGRQIRQSVCM